MRSVFLLVAMLKEYSSVGGAIDVVDSIITLKVIIKISKYINKKRVK